LLLTVKSIRELAEDSTALGVLDADGRRTLADSAAR